MKEEVRKLISEFVKNEFPKIYDINRSRRIWKEQSEQFQTFWEDRIINDESDLSEDEMIPAVQILDVVGRRRNEQEKKVEGVAFTGIRQNTWYKMFRELKSNRRVKEHVDRFLRSSSDAEQIELLNKIREDGTDITALTGENGTVLNAFLFAFNPEKNISAVALSDRYKIINFFEIGEVKEFQSLSWGERIILTRQKIMTLNEKFNLRTDGRGICAFLYSDEMKRLWKPAPRIRISSKKEVTVYVPEEEEVEEIERASLSEKERRTSIMVQAKLAEIGETLDFKIWIPSSDRARVLEIWKPKEDVLLEELPLVFDETTLRTIRNIDVLWIRRRSIIRAFEVENTTSIFSGILRMADLLALQPMLDIKIHIVAPNERRSVVFTQIKRPVFADIAGRQLSQVCSYISYDSVFELGKEKKLKHMNDTIIDDYSEYIEE
jgi:hypothetical protein